MDQSILLSQVRTGSSLGACIRFAKTKLTTIAHEKRVAEIVVRLFDLTRSEHRLSAGYRTLLHAAALLHDIGRCKGGWRHHVRGQEMILQDLSLPLSSPERQLIGFLIRYHRKKIPGKSRVLRSLPDFQVNGVYTLLALIKAADALDSRKAPPRAVSIRREGNSLFVHCFLADNPRKTIHALSGKRKFKLLRQTLGLSLDFKFVR